ncbi:hypothetical protein [Winogradskyella alexanderae]|uniref:Uncharacterized protein n=1 Tax=Winogradskyella alexanderae TaxID=2877123 RepID=A0ABS7XLT7_9FLAO|nr:hypothetical protein [Winogradskyella alexanderae]MCA0130960.1 hypothetical protein [Winogradskyella alexanderae]
MKYRIALVVFTLFSVTKAWSQCAMCRAVLESGDDQAAAEGINDGIVFLMAIPYILVGVFGYIIYRQFNKSPKQKNIT